MRTEGQTLAAEGKVKEKKRAGKERRAEYLDTAEGLADEDALSMQQFQSL